MELWTAFMLGLVGSLHCAGMCGPLAIALPVAGATPIAYLAGRISYNLGRVLTYGVLGLFFGLIGRSLMLAGLQRWVSIGLGVLLLAGLLGSRQLSLTGPVSRLVSRLKSAMAGLLHRRSVGALGVLGLLNGLLPCGLVYVAGAAATTTHSTLDGFAYMLAFGLGTVPLMLAISLSGRLIHVSVHRLLLKAVPVSVFLVALLLIVRGLGLGIPYLSPGLAAHGGEPACCHPSPAPALATPDR
ncbi:MAG: sulfite exporter TauE/SafE family protein [Limisphaerales bacterium]